MMKVVKEVRHYPHQFTNGATLQLVMTKNGGWIVKRWGAWPPVDDPDNWKRPLAYTKEYKKYYGDKYGALAHYAKYERALAVMLAARALRG